MNSPAISVIMPVYNAEKFLEESIESILNQTFSNFEFLIFNDCSTDGSLSIINSYQDDRIVLIDSPRNCGYLVHLNKGIRLAKGKYIARMDADDVSMPNRFDKQFEHLENNPNIALVGASGICIDDHGIERSKIEFPVPTNLIFSHLFFGNPFIHSSIFIRKEILNQYKYDLDFYLAEDYYLWSQIAKSYNVSNISQPLVKYRIHPESISIKKQIEQEKCIKKVLDFHLSNIGFKRVSAENKNLHYNLLYYKYDLRTISVREIYRVNSWIKKLIQNNNNLHVYDSSYFNSKLVKSWTCCFNFSVTFKNGIKAIPLVFLYLNRKEKIKVKLRFVFNCLKNEFDKNE